MDYVIKVIISACTYIHGGTGWRSWMRNCAADSIPDGVIGILHDFNSSNLAIACG